jgi:hypothetical protein
MNWYNGYSSVERNRKLRQSKRQFPNRSHPCYQRPCHMCGDPDADVKPHSEDYSVPYLWEPPAVYALCKPCHYRIHTRFARPSSWLAYKLHLRRGGYGSDNKGRIGREVTRLAKTIASGKRFELAHLREKNFTGSEWWERLSTDPRMLADRAARPRP